MSHHIYTTPGIVINSRNTGEANKYLYIFTRDLGMIGASAQSIRLGKSKLRYHSQDFCYSHFSLVKGKDVWRVTSAGNGSTLFSDIKNYQPYFILYVTILSLLKRLLNGEEKHEELFDEIINGFSFITKQPFDKKILNNFERLMVLRILHLLGYIGKTKEFEVFLKNEWSNEILEKSDNLNRKMIMEINRALKESML
ncbi:MAG: DNA repair protein RecO [Patescibacteria group bacterium]|nr:DNA repair protein RecO [Patescibacteria group bacterium]